MAKRIHLTIGGMSCDGCREKIENGLDSTEGILEATVSYARGTADVLYDESRITTKEIESVIRKLGYKVLTAGQAASFDPVNTVSILVIIAALYYMLQSLGLLNRLVPKGLADAGMGYGMLFVVGLFTSVHCIAMCGGIGLSQSLPRSTESGKSAAKPQAILPALFYNLGRVCSYTVIGAVLGLISMLIGGGAEGGGSTLLQGLTKLLAGLVMVVMGINMLGIFPWLRAITIRTPKTVVKAARKRRRAVRTPFVVGLINGFMPCGPLQSMWLVALSSANPFTGALSMFLFGAGTVPLMLGLGSVVSLFGRRFTEEVRRVGAVLVVVLGLSMLSQGGALSGLLSADQLLFLFIAFAVFGVLVSLTKRGHWARYAVYAASAVIALGAYLLGDPRVIENKGAEGEAQFADGVQLVHSTLTSGSYPDITVQAGVPVRWTIDAPEGSVNGCNYRMLIQDYGIEHTFESGENVIEFTPEKAGTIRYSCWMGMIYGNIYIIDEGGYNNG